MTFVTFFNRVVPNVKGFAYHLPGVIDGACSSSRRRFIATDGTLSSSSLLRVATATTTAAVAAIRKEPSWLRTYATIDDDSTTTTTTTTSPSSPQSSSSSSPWTLTKTTPNDDDGDDIISSTSSSSRRSKRGINKSRFRQHVNPLARKFQMPTEQLSEDWPRDGSFEDPMLPLHIDIGCGKGGFLLSLASERKKDDNQQQQDQQPPQPHERKNYLGLEIRPTVAQYARERITKWNLYGTVDFIGCNANVDLDRILHRYTTTTTTPTTTCGTIATVSIQFPDPHFKKQHRKRRVVTPSLVTTLARYLPEGAVLFMQSDVKDVLDGMRLAVVEDGGDYFVDSCGGGLEEYVGVNPMGVATEREVSVLEKGGEVWRVLFVRSGVVFRGEE